MKVPFTRPDLGAAELAAVTRALQSGALGGNGAISKRVQNALAERLGVPHVLLAPNATQAFEMALIGLGLGPGDEVLLPSFSYVSMANAVLARGARPTFCDVRADTLNLDVQDAERRLSERTRLIMPVHYAGVACDMDALQALSERSGVALFEDAAQALGGAWRGRPLGTLAPLGCLSFHVTKNVTCGEGGALLIQDEALWRRLEIVQEKGTNRSAFLRGEVDKYTWVDRGGSYVVSDLLAAVLEVQLAREQELRAARLALWQLYREGLADLERSGLARLPHVPADAEHNAHLFFLVAESHTLQRRLLEHLRGRGIEATFHFQPLHSSPFARTHLGTGDLHLPETERAAMQLVRLPLHPGLSAADVRFVIDETLTAARVSRPAG